MTLRRILVLVVTAFTAYFLVRGIVVATIVPLPWLQLLLTGLWLVAVVLTVWSPGIDPRDGAQGNRAPSRLPALTAAVIVGLVVCATVLTAAASGPMAHEPLVATMFGAAGVPLVAVVVRRRPIWAWAGTVAVAALGISMMGPARAFGRGLLGTILWVGVAQLILWSIDRAYLDTARLVRLQQVSASWQVTQDARRSERRRRVRYALQVAGPALTRVVHGGGRLTEGERRDALLAEGTLRDELRAHRLLDDEVRMAVRSARESGATVTVIDDDGLDELAPSELRAVRSRLAETLRSTDADRIIVRTTSDPAVAVTVVGRSASSGAHDEDDLVLWEEIPRMG